MEVVREGPGGLGDERANLGVLREPALPLFGEDQLTVGEDVVLALRALFDPGLVLGLRVQLGRETRGPFVVAVSDGAVEDSYLRHGWKPSGSDRLELLEGLPAALAVTERTARRGSEDVLEPRVGGVAVRTAEGVAPELDQPGPAGLARGRRSEP